MQENAMQTSGADAANSPDLAKQQILDAAVPHVAFDGWSDTTLAAALQASGHAQAMGAGLFPRGGVDLAIAYHRAGDRALQDALGAQDLSALRYSARIATALKLRLTLADKDAVRKAAALFALPRYAPEGAQLIWGTADAIWQALGDTSDDFNWYSKRATLAAVYSSAVLYWLGDTSEGDADTQDFIDRRIENVMQIETLKSSVRNNRIAMAVLSGPLKVLERISAPQRPSDLPGQSQR
jgi:ubiquinone biosynthesis protein COQ9